MGAEASRLDGEKATFRYGAHSLVLWATERVDALFEEDGQFYEAEIQGFEDGQVRVLFVEYGNEQMCAFEDLRPMCEYRVGDEIEGKYAVDEEWYPAVVVDFDEEFREYTIQFSETKEEQICDRSFLRPLPDVVDQLVQAEIARQREEGQQERRARGATKNSVQKRLEAKEKEMQQKKKQQVDDDEFGDLSAALGSGAAAAKNSRPPPPSEKVLTVADALASSDEDVPQAKKAEPAKKPSMMNPIAAAAAAAVAAKKAVVNPIAAAAAALVAKKQAEPKQADPKQRVSKRNSKRLSASAKRASLARKAAGLFSSDEDNAQLVEAADDPFAVDDPFADKPLFSDGEPDDEGSGDDTDDLDDEAVAAQFLAAKTDDAEAKKREQEEQRLLREQMYSKKAVEEDVEWLSGEECEAKWAEDDNWYKAMVIGAEPDGTYTVEFTEYNQLQECTAPSDMRRLGAGDAARKEEQAPPSDGEGDGDSATPGKGTTSSSDEPSPLPLPKGPAAPPKVSVPALNLSASPLKTVAPKAAAKALVGKLTVTKVASSSDEDDETPKADSPEPVKAPAPVPAPVAAAPAKKTANLHPPPKKSLPPVVPSAGAGGAAAAAAKKKAQEDEEARKRQEAKEKAKLEAEERQRKAEEEERLRQKEEEERQQLLQEEEAAAEEPPVDRDMEEMAALLEPEQYEHHDLEGPPASDLEGLFEDDQFMDFLPDDDGAAFHAQDDLGDEGDASQIFGIFDGDDMGIGGDGAAGGPKDAFLRFSLNRDALDASEVVNDFRVLREAAGIAPMGSEIDPRLVRKGLRAAIEKEMDFKSPKLGIFKLLDKQSKRQDVLACGDTMAGNLRALVVGAGIGGLRVACELALLGVRVVVVEKRTAFTRNNVLHLWSHVVADVQALGAAFWVPGFCKGNIHHCAIRKLQLCLLRSALLLGVDVFLGVAFEGVERKRGQWRAKCDNVVIADYDFNVLIGADGEASKVASFVGFDKKETAYSLALGITANFENSKTKSQLGTAEVNVARHFKQAWFAKLASEKGIELENMVYYKDDTHYFVCTALKESLITKGVLRQDIPDLVSPANVNRHVLQTWCEEVAAYAGLPKSASLVSIVRADGTTQLDTAIFDFSRKFRAVVPMRVFASSEDTDELLWTFVIGDALMEPFWPLGTGANRAVLSAWDTMATLVQVGMTGLTTASACGDSLAPIAEAAMSMYAALQASDPNTMKPEKFRMPGEPSPLYSFDPNTRYPRLKAGAVPEGEGEIIDWAQFVPGSNQVINTMSKGDTAKRRMSNPFKPKAIAAGAKSPPPAKGPAGAAKKAAMTSVVPPKKAAPAPSRVSVDLGRISVAPPNFAAPAPGSKSVIESGTPQAAALSPAPVTKPKLAATSPPAKKVAPSVAVPASVKKPVAAVAAAAPSLSGSSSAVPDLNKNPKSAIAALAANEASYEILDLSGNTMFSMKHRDYAKELGAALRNNSVVKEVHLKSCDLDKVDVQELCEGIVGHTSLVVLDLEKNKIDNEGAEIIANALRNNWSIRELNLLGQQRAFGDACLTAFVDMFDYNVTLTKIIWRLDSRKSFAINKLLVRNNTIQKNLLEKRDVSALIPAHCNVPDLSALGGGGGSLRGSATGAELEGAPENDVAPAEEDDDYCATVDLNVAVKPRAATVEQARAMLDIKPPVSKPGLEDFEDDLYDEPTVAAAAVAPTVVAPASPAGARRPSSPAPVAKKAARPGTVTAPAPVPVPVVAAAVKAAPVRDSGEGEGDDDDYCDTVDLNAVVPARAPAKPAAVMPRPGGPARGVLPPQVTAGGRLRAMSGRGKAPNTTVLLATKLPPRKTADPAPIPAASLPTRKVTASAASAVAPGSETKKLSVAAPANAPAEVVKVYEDLSALNDRFLALEDDDDMSQIGPELIAELARLRDEMLPLHTKYKIAGYVVGAVAKWRNLNGAIPKRVNG